jgi:hypothetical protein
MTSRLINTGDLDFSSIKQNLKMFLSDQDELADYDFDGSVISTVIDLLAYNTHYNALYTNMAINEMFIDSASKRSSISSLAKLLGYVPRSVSSARANVDITVGTYGISSNVLTLDAGATFTTEVNNTQFTFNLIEPISITKLPSESFFTFANVLIYEGSLGKITYVANPETRYVVPELNVDTTTIKISVFDPSNSSTTIYNNAKSTVDTKSTDNVFFIRHVEDNLYEVTFGDGTFGTVVPNGCVVTMRYLISSGAAANAAAIFSYAGGLDSTKGYDIVTNLASAMGSDEEDKESIRFFAPLSYQAQNRAVTANDYAAVVSEMYPQIESINVWGGQDNIPPQYGKVFISAKPYGRDVFSTLEKNEIKQGILGRRSMVTVTPEFVDPAYYNIEIEANVYYAPGKTAYTAGELANQVTAVINDYGNTLAKFESAYRHSVLTTKIDSTELSIVSSINTIRIRYTIKPMYNVEKNYSINFYNPIASSNTATFFSTRFYMKGYTDRGYLKNNGSDIEFYTEDANGVPFYQETVGTIDFNGKINLNNITLTSLYDEQFEFVFYPSSYDVIPPNGVIVRMKPEHVKVNILVDKLSQVRNARTEHVFSLSR